MADDVVESKEDMKKKMEKIKKKKETAMKASSSRMDADISSKKTLNKKEPLNVKKPGMTTSETEIKIKKEPPQSREKMEANTGEMRDVKEGLQDVKTKTQEGLQDIRVKTSAKTEQIKKDSAREGRNPAEKFLSDILTGFKQKTDDASQTMGERGITKPDTDILETNESITIISDIPGLERDKIEIGITRTSVEITATYKEEPPVASANFIQKERGYGVVHRILDLPNSIDVDKTTATYKNCILTIQLPKKEKELTKITINE